MKARGFLVASALAAGCQYDWTPPPADATKVDAGGSSDAASAADASSSFTCAGALLCDRFDTGPIGATWANTFVATGGDVHVEAFAGALSLPNVLFASRPAQTAPPSTAYVTSVLTTKLTRAKIAFAVHPDQLDATAHVCVAGITFGDGTADEKNVRVLVGQAGALVQEKAPTLRALPLTTAPAVGAWSRMSLAVEASGHIVVTLDGATVLDAAADPSWAASTSTRVFVGVNFVEAPSKAVELRFDDVRVDGS